MSKPLFTRSQAKKLASNFPPADIGGDMNGKPEKKADPPIVCRACGREQTGQDPNVAGRKFLAALIGKMITVRISQEWSVTGTLKRFDNYSLVIGLHDQEDVIVFKGPGIVVRPDAGAQ